MTEAIEALRFRLGQELEIWEDQGKGKQVKVRYLVAQGIFIVGVRVMVSCFSSMPEQKRYKVKREEVYIISYEC